MFRNLFRHIKTWFSTMADAFRSEVLMSVQDLGAMIFFLALPLAYPIVYTLIYNPEVVDNIPVVVVDDCRTAASRDFVRRASAAPAIDIYDYAPDMNAARRIVAEQKAYAIFLIPEDYDKAIGRGEQAHVKMYCDMSLLLRYRALLQASTALQLELAQDITAQRVAEVGASSLGASMSGGLPVASESHFLGDTQDGFASFVIPGIVVLILQQSMILGVALLGATRRERLRAYSGPVDALPKRSASAIVWGKTLWYVLLYIPSTIYILHWIPEMFSLPHHGSPADYLPFIFPLLLASAFLGQAVVALCREREYVFLVIVFTSLIFLFLSGLTWPRYAMGTFWTAVSNLVPATWGVEGFIRINSNAATLAQNATPYLWMWGLAVLYFILAVIVTRRYRINRVLPD